MIVNFIKLHPIKTVLLLLVIGLFVWIGFMDSYKPISLLLDRYTRVFNLLSGISLLFGGVGLTLTYLSRQESLKQNQYNVINGLMSRYSLLIPELLSVDRGIVDDQDRVFPIIIRYFQFSEEQLFYIGKELVPNGIDEIWLNGIKEQLKTFLDQEDVDENNLQDHLTEESYPNLHLLLSSYLLNRDITNNELKTKIRDHINERYI